MKNTHPPTPRELVVLRFVLRKAVNPHTRQVEPLVSPEEEAEAIEQHVDLIRGGLKARSINSVRAAAPDIYSDAWTHRQHIQKLRVSAGETVKLEISGIPRDTPRNVILKDLGLSDAHLEVFTLASDLLTIRATIFAKTVDGERLLNLQSSHRIAGGLVQITRA